MNVIEFPRKNSLNRDAQDVPGFPSLERKPAHQFSTSDIDWILRGGERTSSSGLKSRRRAMTSDAARNWLTAAHAKGEIDDEQVRLFMPVGEG